MATPIINRHKVLADSVQLEADAVAEEAPLLIQLRHRNTSLNFTLTMRTPGKDVELAIGLLFSEGVILNYSDIKSIEIFEVSNESTSNHLEVELTEAIEFDAKRYHRNLTSYSGCGLCGKTSLQALELKQSRTFKPQAISLTNELIARLKQLMAERPLFAQTGGVHTAGLVPLSSGRLDLCAANFFEDVGRHNALDKLIGDELRQYNLERSGIVVLSGRIGFELVQKVIMAGYSIIVALGAPSHLAIQAANQFDVALIGFAKRDSFNLYTSHTALIEKL